MVLTHHLNTHSIPTGGGSDTFLHDAPVCPPTTRPTVPASRLTQSTARTASQTRELSMICAKSLTVKHSGRSQEHGEDGYSTRNQALARHEWERIRKKEERRKGEGGDWQIWKRVEDRRKRNTNTLIQTASPTLVFYPRDAELIEVKHGPQVKSRPVSEI